MSFKNHCEVAKSNILTKWITDLFGSLMYIIQWRFKNESEIPNDFVFSPMTEMEMLTKWRFFFFSTLLWFSLPKPWVRTVKRLSFVNQMIRHLCQHSTILPDSVSIHVRSFTFMFFFSSFFYYVLKRPTLRLYCLDWVSCVRLSLSVISVSATEVDGYSKTAGAWILSLNRNLYPVNNVAECAARCDGEIAFTCRCSPLFPLTFSTHTKEQHMTLILKCIFVSSSKLFSI